MSQMPPKNKSLVEWSDWHSVTILKDNHIELRWGWIYIKMRMVDLLVIGQLFDQWFEDHGDVDPFVGFTLWLNSEKIYLSPEDFLDLADLIGEAINSLPRKVVRWADLKAEIVSHYRSESGVISPLNQLEKMTSFSAN